MHDFLGLGIGLGRFIGILVFGYFTIKWAVRNGIEEAYTNITGKETYENKEVIKALELDKKDNSKKEK